MKMKLCFSACLLWITMGHAQENKTPSDKPQKSGNISGIFTAIEDPPEFPGGMSSLMQYLSTHIKYPKDAREYGVQGKVIVKFVVCKDGSLCDETIEKSVMPSIDSEVIKVVQAMPNWKPGKQNGEAVKVFYTLPVNFNLEEDNKPAVLDSFINAEAVNARPVYTAVEWMPQFKGGREQCEKFVKEHLVYPEDAKEMHIQGTVVVKFIVDEEGLIRYPKVEKSIYYKCDEEALKIIRSMPPWDIGKQNGKPVKVLYTLPITFKL